MKQIRPNIVLLKLKKTTTNDDLLLPQLVHMKKYVILEIL